MAFMAALLKSNFILMVTGYGCRYKNMSMMHIVVERIAFHYFINIGFSTSLSTNYVFSLPLQLYSHQFKY